MFGLGPGDFPLKMRGRGVKKGRPGAPGPGAPLGGGKGGGATVPSSLFFFGGPKFLGGGGGGFFFFFLFGKGPPGGIGVRTLGLHRGAREGGVCAFPGSLLTGGFFPGLKWVPPKG